MTEQTTWELVNPEGAIQFDTFNMKPHPPTLKNKTVLFHWNAKHNGDVFLNKIAELLVESVEDVKIIKSWEVAPETAINTGTKEEARKIAKKLADFKPDIVIGAQAD